MYFLLPQNLNDGNVFPNQDTNGLLKVKSMEKMTVYMYVKYIFVTLSTSDPIKNII